MCGGHTLLRQLHIAAPVVGEDKVESRVSRATYMYGVVSWSQSHEASPTEPVPRSQSHGVRLSHKTRSEFLNTRERPDSCPLLCESLAPQDYIHVHDVQSLQSNGLLDSFHFC